MKFDKTLIPKNTPYCYEPIAYENGVFKVKPCPYWEIRTIEEGEWKGERVEYCRYLDKELDVQDQVKDCEVE